MLNVQLLGTDELQALPEGERSVKRVKAFGSKPITAANEFDGTPGDWLLYRGQWYECTASFHWEHGMIIDHWESQFTLLDKQPEEDASEDSEELPWT
jgi:hypothetical protein